MALKRHCTLLKGPFCLRSSRLISQTSGLVAVLLLIFSWSRSPSLSYSLFKSMGSNAILFLIVHQIDTIRIWLLTLVHGRRSTRSHGIRPVTLCYLGFSWSQSPPPFCSRGCMGCASKCSFKSISHDTQTGYELLPTVDAVDLMAQGQLRYVLIFLSFCFVFTLVSEGWSSISSLGVWMSARSKIRLSFGWFVWIILCAPLMSLRLNVGESDISRVHLAEFMEGTHPAS